MLEHILKLESKVGNKTGHFLFDNDTPIESVKSMLIDFITFVGNYDAQVKAQAAGAPVTQAPLEGVQMEVPAPSDAVSQSISSPTEPQAE